MTKIEELNKKEITPIKWDESFWFFDIDDTLIDTAVVSSQASTGISQVFAAEFGAEMGQKVQDEFNSIFALMVAGYRVKSEKDWEEVQGGKVAFETLISQIEKVQPEITKKYGAIKKWSREIFIKIVADKLNLTVDPDLIQKAADAYWETLTEITTVIPGVLDLINDIKAHNRPICLLTSSDARLKMKPDGTFEYDPVYSEAKKSHRIELLKQKGIVFDVLSIGDPEDKPHQDFFKKAIAKAETMLGLPIDPAKSIIIGDSYGGDLATPKEQMGFGLIVLFQKGKSTEIVDLHQINTGNISEVVNFLSS